MQNRTKPMTINIDIDTLPQDCINEICSYLPYFFDLVNLRLTNKSLNSLIEKTPAGRIHRQAHTLLWSINPIVKWILKNPMISQGMVACCNFIFTIFSLTFFFAKAHFSPAKDVVLASAFTTGMIFLNDRMCTKGLANMVSNSRYGFFYRSQTNQMARLNKFLKKPYAISSLNRL
jgi:F-box associated protein